MARDLQGIIVTTEGTCSLCDSRIVCVDGVYLLMEHIEEEHPECVIP